ncbi:hypothetical protein BLX05_28790, partial [Bacillus pseudomycoides]
YIHIHSVKVVNCKKWEIIHIISICLPVILVVQDLKVLSFLDFHNKYAILHIRVPPHAQQAKILNCPQNDYFWDNRITSDFRLFFVKKLPQYSSQKLCS